MQGAALLVSGCVFLASLAAPAVLFASEEEAPAPAAAAPAEPEPGAEAVQPPGAPEGAGEPEGVPEVTANPQPEPAAPPSGSSGQLPDSSAGEVSGDPVQTVRSKRPRAGAAATRTVIMRDLEFHPRRITVGVGDTVRWVNEDSEPHNATGKNGSFETETFNKGGEASHTFNRAGEFPYFCTIHAGMTGTIQVGRSSGGGGGSGGGGSGGGGSGTGGTSTSGTGAGTTGFGSSSSGTTSSLPATGHDVVWLALVGGALLTLGAALKLLAARRY
jgi:LPXTG-motif cell wall-anchored protein